MRKISRLGFLRACAAGAWAALAACSNSGTDASGGAGGAGTGQSSGASSMSTNGSSMSTGTGAGGSSSLGGPFQYGMNFGYVPGFTDPEMAQLARDTGANGARISFPESFFAEWGYSIELADNQAYQSIGIRNNVAFLTSPTREHSTAPANVPDWEVPYYIPSNLYEPIFAGDGSVNPSNHWAKYVEQTMSTYKDHVQIYSVWNEPDWVSDWQVTLDWDTTAPDKGDLPRFNGSIHDYVRMLRITHEVAQKIDPSIKVAVGGLGYPSFLGAILRYTDNPDGGAVTADYPSTGAAYFDVLDMHYYPIFGPGSSDVGAEGLVESKDKFQKVLDDADAGPRPFIVTENGAPRVSVGGAPGGVDYARNYLIKSMVLAQGAGIAGVHWFILSDGADQATSSFGSMGCYEDLAGKTPATAKRTPTGEAYRTLGALLEDAKFDPDSTIALGLPDGAAVRGVAFVTKEGKHATVLWARAAGNDEAASGSYDLAASGPVARFDWDAASKGMASTTLTPAGGKVSLTLDATPVFIVAD